MLRRELRGPFGEHNTQNKITYNTIKGTHLFSSAYFRNFINKQVHLGRETNKKRQSSIAFVNYLEASLHGLTETKITSLTWVLRVNEA